MNKNYLYPIIISAILISLTRYPVKLFSLLSFVALIPLYHGLYRLKTNKEIVFSAFVFASIYNLLVLHWIALVTFWGYVGTFLLFFAYYYLLFFLINRISHKFHKLYPLVFLSFFISFEYLQNFGEFCFPWFNLGYSLSENLTLIQVADVGGVFLVSVLVIISNILIYKIMVSKHKLRYFFIFAIFVSLWVFYGKYKLSHIEIQQTKEKISLIQGNIPMDIKWDETFFDSTMLIYKKLSLDAKKKDKSKFVIWPESAITQYFLKNFEVRKDLVYFAKNHKLNIFSGFQDYDYNTKNLHRKYRLFNAATQIDTTGYISKPYYKIKLVPFGERMPFLRIFPFLWSVQLGQANFNYGNTYRVFKYKDYRYSSLICFEIAFPFLTKEFSRKNVDFFVNITNDAWFKKSIGTYQHKMMAVFRAIETRRQVFRCANTGYSVIVSPTGKILKSTNLYERTYITYPILLCKEKTIFTKYLYKFPLLLTLLNIIVTLFYLKKIIMKKG